MTDPRDPVDRPGAARAPGDGMPGPDPFGPAAPRGWRAAVRHAFAVDSPGPAEPSPEEAEPIDRMCHAIERRGLTTPGLIALEMSRPLNYVASATLQMLQPTLEAILPEVTATHARNVSKFLEQRGSIDYIARRLETIEREKTEREHAERDAEAATDATDATGATGAPAGARTDDTGAHPDDTDAPARAAASDPPRTDSTTPPDTPAPDARDPRQP